MADTDSRASLENKRRFIEAYFGEISARAAFLDELRARGHFREALLLCCCYIDGLASGLYGPARGPHENFVRVIRELGGNDVLNRVHPVKLRTWLNSRAPDQLKRLRPPLGDLLDVRELFTVDEFCARAASRLTEPQVSLLRPELWRGTLASLAYEQLRCALVHHLTAPDAIAFSTTTSDGAAAPEVGFEQLRPVLDHVLDAIARVSVETAKWFGHDYKYRDREYQQREPAGRRRV